ncbi:MAG TPA: PAN domain-containing protein [Pyrinomonadaceae bacterium]|nr:PAN domain-containing protein [Pyrinomonadaceae bacterium]
MKICRICNRTYADETMNFCLEDGATLSEFNDPNQNQSLPPTMLPAPAPTEIFSPGSMPSDSRGALIPTIQSPQPPQLYSPKPAAAPVSKTKEKKWGGGVVGAFLIVGIGVLSIIWLAQRDGSNMNRDTVITNNNLQPSPSATATKENKVWNERKDAVSLQGVNLTYYRGTTPERCQSDCEENAECKGFTFIRQGAYNPADPPMCYLASKVTGEAAHSCCISGVKR